MPMGKLLSLLLRMPMARVTPFQGAVAQVHDSNEPVAFAGNREALLLDLIPCTAQGLPYDLFEAALC